MPHRVRMVLVLTLAGSACTEILGGLCAAVRHHYMFEHGMGRHDRSYIIYKLADAASFSLLGSLLLLLIAIPLYVVWAHRWRTRLRTDIALLMPAGKFGRVAPWKPLQMAILGTGIQEIRSSATRIQRWRWILMVTALLLSGVWPAVVFRVGMDPEPIVGMSLLWTLLCVAMILLIQTATRFERPRNLST